MRKRVGKEARAKVRVTTDDIEAALTTANTENVTPHPHRPETKVLYPQHNHQHPQLGSNLFIANFNFNTTNEELQELFEKKGKVVSCQIQRDPTTR